MSWTVGRDTVYLREERDGAVFAVPKGRSFDDKSVVFKVERESRSGKEYFINCDTQKRRWTLPPLNASTRGLRERVAAFYEHYNPEKLKNVDVTLEMYAGRPDELIIGLQDKYGPEPPYYPAPTRRESYRKRLVAFYSRYNPAKVADADKLLDTFEKREEEMFRNLVEKYGAEPPVVEDEKDDSEIRERVTAMYRKYNPDKIGNVDRQLQRYAGQEALLMEELVTRYGAEPVPGSDSAAAVSTAVEPSTPAGSTAGKARTHRERLVALYERYAPARVAKVDAHLAKNAGNEDAFIAAMVEKLGPEPSPPPATPASSAPAATSATAAAPVPQKQSEEAVAAPPAAAASAADRVRAMYARYRPDKPHLAEASLKQYDGQHDVLLNILVDKYGPEPATAAPATNETATTGAAAAPGHPSQQQQQQTATTRATAADEEEESADVAPRALGATQREGGGSDRSTPANTPPSQEAPHRDSPVPISASNEEGSRTPPTHAAEAPTKASSAERSTADAATPNSNNNAPPAPAAEVALGEHAIFSEYSSSPPNVKQQLLLNFLNDREARLKDALAHNQRTVAAMTELRAKNATLSEEVDAVANNAKTTASALEQEAARARERAEDSQRLWKLEKEQLIAQQQVAMVAAQRALNECRLQFEEERSRKVAELHEVRRRAAAADADVRAVTESSSKLLHTLEERQRECQSLRDQIEELRRRAMKPETADVTLQTDVELLEALLLQSQILADAHSPGRTRQLGDHTPSAAVRVGSASPHAGGGGGDDQPMYIPCHRCQQKASRFACKTCRLLLCRGCCAQIHSANGRFRQHVLRELPPPPSASSVPRRLLDSQVPASRHPHAAGSSGLRSVSKVSQSDAVATFDAANDIEAEFDAVMAEHERSRRSIEEYQDIVAQLEEQIAMLNGEIATLRATGTAPSVSAEIERRERAQAEAERAQIVELTTANAALAERVAELELQLLAQPDPDLNRDGGEAEAAALRREVSELTSLLSDARAQVREHKQEIRQLRGRLQVQMSSPFGRGF